MPDSSVDWAALVAKVKGGDPMGNEELKRLLSRGIRFYLSRRLGQQNLDQRVQETFTLLANAIKTEDLPEPEALMDFARTIVIEQAAAYRDEESLGLKQPRDEWPGMGPKDKNAVHPKDIDRMVAVLMKMSPDGREALTRFYFSEQSQQKVCEEMHLSKKQFLRLKADAKAYFVKIKRAMP